MRFPGKTLFGGPKPQEPLPVIPEPAVAPDPDDKAIKIAKRRKVAQRAQRSGRISTINTEPQSTTLG